MDCNVEAISSEVAIPNQLTELDDDFYNDYSLASYETTKSTKMGIENSWGTDDYTATPLTDLAIPLPPPDPAALLKYDANTVNNSSFSEDIERLVSNRGSDQEDISDQSCEGGVCGLINLGNTCFMSAGVQCLIATAPLIASLINISSTYRLTNSVADLIRNVWSGKQSSLNPSEFKNSVSAQFPQFSDYRQHDCQEFLALLLDGLHEQLNLTKKKGASLLDSSGDIPSSSLKLLPLENEEYVPAGTSYTNYIYLPSKINESNIINDLIGDNNAKKSNIKLNSTINKTTSELNNSEECSSKNNKTCINKNSYNPNSDNIITTNNALNKSDTKITSLEDIVKNAKTSNVNVMVTEEEANNEIRFDSEKYPRNDYYPRRKTEGCTVNSFHLYENNIIGKRCKSTLTKYTSGETLKEGLDLKRVRLNSPSDEAEEKNKRMESERQQKLSDDKNKRMESERKECIINEFKDGSEPSSSGLNTSEIRCENTGEPEADSHWKMHLSENRSVIVDTFQGQFKSTVVCSNCKFVSITYEPFMYLSVPLPNTMRKKFCVTYVSESLEEPPQYLLQVNKYDNVGVLKKQLLKKIDSDERDSTTVIGEVLDHHIAKLLDDNSIIRNINDSDRNIYAFKIINVADSSETKTEDSNKDEECLVDNRCTICLEDKHSIMKQHIGCTCVICETCITAACQHFHGSPHATYGTYFECPLCRREVNPETQMIPIINDRQFTIRSVNISVVFRMDSTNVGNNNEKGVKLFGHPRLLRIPNRVSAEVLHAAIKEIVPYDNSYRLLTVDGQGSRCSRCMFNMHCYGCDIPDEGQISLFSSDTLAVTFSSPVEMLNQSPPCSAISPGTRKRQISICLYDCITAFSQSERLDESNPWYCPKCLEPRCATKTLAVWRYPDYLIVYLKRFVFHNRVITKLDEKVEFPLNGLTLGSQSSQSVYDLYGVVCHIGGVTAGHYTAYTKQPYTGVWHYFNDCYVSNKAPQEEDLRNAYILFYQKRGINVPTLDIEVKSSISEFN